jgi:hypothetical protein
MPYARAPVDIDALPGPQGTRRFAAWLADRASVTIPEVLEALTIEPAHQTRALAMRVGEALRDHGWSPTARRGSGTRSRVYTPPAPVVG